MRTSVFFHNKENEKDTEFRPRLEVKEASDNGEEYEEHFLEDINLNTIKEDSKSSRKEDRSSSTPIKGKGTNTSHKKSAISLKDTTKHNTGTLPVIESDAGKQMNTSKSYSLSKSYIGHKDFVDLKGPISSEIFLSIKKSDILEDYQVGKLLGEGSYGKVKLVLHRRTNIERAMKVVVKAGVSKEEKELMMKEVSILKSLDHPNIIKIFDLYEDESKLYLVTE